VLAVLGVVMCIAVFRSDGRHIRVLLVGDSISQQYAPGVSAKLGSAYQVETTSENGQSSRNLLAHLDEWVISRQPDIVVLNAGLHDVAERGDGPVPIDEYAKNLLEMVRRIRTGTGARLIWATTTPVIDDVHLRVHGFVRRERDVERYNAAALKVMKSLGVEVVDLHAVLMAGDPAKLCEDGVHPGPAGQALLADAVARAVRGK
jgi:lysophospholipase L1-like esterase